MWWEYWNAKLGVRVFTYELSVILAEIFIIVLLQKKYHVLKKINKFK